MGEERELGPVGTKVVFENEQVRVWVLSSRPASTAPYIGTISTIC